MRKSLFVSLLLVGSQMISAQETVSIGEGYVNEKWYNLEEGEVGSSVALDWEIAFDLKAQDAALRINDGNGVKLYEYAGGIEAWDDVDTTGMATWTPLYNSSTEWKTGAFNQIKDPEYPQPMFDYGWGTYDMASHFVVGSRIFVIKLKGGAVKKIWIKQMAGGVYTFTYANIDGTEEVDASLVKADFDGKQFGYYSITNNEVVDREPVLKAEWDLLFVKYMEEVDYMGNMVSSPVAGVLGSENITVASVSEVADVENFDAWYGQDFSSNINTIGWEWEGYNFQTHSYTVLEDQVYFVKAQSGNVYKLVFTDFGGTATGDFVFTKELMSTASITDNGIQNPEVLVYPNPATSTVSLVLNNLQDQQAEVQILNLAGQAVYQNNVVGDSNFEVKNIAIDHLNAGVYFVKVVSGNQEVTNKLIVR